MPRKPLIRSNLLPYHVNARANNRETFPIPLPQLWGIVSTECLNLNYLYGVEIHSFVLMPNHFHMMLTVPEYDLGKMMNVFISSVTRSFNWNSGRSGHLFGGPYHWSLIESARYFGHALKYVYRNPVKAGICERVQDYRYGTLQGLLGQACSPFPLYLTRTAMETALPSLDAYEQLDWLNLPFPDEIEAAIKKGLKRKVFGPVLDREERKPIAALEQLA